MPKRTNVAALACAGALIASIAWPGTLAAQTARAEREQARATLAQARERAIETVHQAAESDDPMLRANAIEAIQWSPEHAPALAKRGLADRNPAVRFSALVTIGRLQIVELAENARRLTRDDHPSVRAAALYATRACGREEVNISPIADMLAARDPGVRSNAAMLLGLLGDPSAVPMLKELAHAPMPRVSAVHHALVRKHIAEALVELGEEEALDALRAGAYSHHDEVRVLSVQALGKLGDRQMEAAFAELVESNEPIELRLAAAEALARIGTAGPATLAVMHEGADWDDPPVRAQAAFTLGLVRHPDAAGRLLALLSDDASAQVRLSAAAAVLRALEQ